MTALDWGETFVTEAPTGTDPVTMKLYGIARDAWSDTRG